jgi:hypothetical protein
MLAEFQQAIERRFFHTVIKDHLSFDILDDPEHEIDFFFFRLQGRVNPEKGIQYFQRLFAGFEAFPALLIQKGDEVSDIRDFPKRQAQKQAVINIEPVFYGFYELCFPRRLIHGQPYAFFGME